MSVQQRVQFLNPKRSQPVKQHRCVSVGVQYGFGAPTDSLPPPITSACLTSALLRRVKNLCMLL